MANVGIEVTSTDEIAMAKQGEAVPARAHPLGLTAQEILDTASLIRACWPEESECRFKVLTLLEPPKSQLLPYLMAERSGQPPGHIDRKAFVVYSIRGTVSITLVHPSGAR
jgi:Cu2+-containing amine oxidase